MDTLTLDVRHLPDEKIQQLRRLVESWKQEAGPGIELAPSRKRRVHPSEFAPGLTKFKVPLARALAYEE